MAVGLAASLPQILRMMTARSAGGQSVVGWSMGCVTNVSMAYVNFFGFHATALTVSNIVSASLCVAAVMLILRFREEPAAVSSADDLALTIEIPLSSYHQPETFEARRSHIAGLPTTEFDALRDAVLSAEEERRERRADDRAMELVAQVA